MVIVFSLQKVRTDSTKILGRIGLVVGLTAALVSCTGRQKDVSSDSTQPQSSTAKDSVVIVLTGEDSVSVLELVQRDHEVVLRSSAIGKFVTAIDSLESSASVFWIYTVNGSGPAVACDRFLTSDGDTVRWHFQKAAP